MKKLSFIAILPFAICSILLNNTSNPYCLPENINNFKKSNKSSFLTDSIITYQSDSLTEINSQMDCVSSIFNCSDNIWQIKTIHEQFKDFNLIDISNNQSGWIYKKKLKKDGTLMGESFINPCIGLIYHKNYKDEKLYSYGFTSREQRVGNWRSLSKTGNLDSIIDYDKNKKMTYCKFFEIARAFGMVGKSSRMPGRQKLFQVADSLGLTVILSGIIYYNLRAGWMNYEFYPIKEEEINERFQSEIFYDESQHYSEWTAIKKFRIGEQQISFSLSLDPERMSIRQHEELVEPRTTGTNIYKR